MTKSTLFKIIIIIFLLIMVVGLAFFKKDKNEPEPKNNQPIDQQPIKEQEKEPAKKEAVKTTAEIFATIYYSYTWGNFSNIESQYYYMTAEMKNREESKIIEMKKGAENQPQKYFTARATLINSEFVSYDERKTSLKIDLSIDNFAGAMVQRDTLVWVDENGNYYGGDINNLILNTVEKNIEINLLKVDDKWKVDQIEEK